MPSLFPDWIEPMAATLTQERFTGPEWSFERKFDGIRLLAYKKGKQVELFSRNRLRQKLPAVSQAIAELRHDQLILDGEITWGRGQLTYHVFDIMWIDGREVMSLPLEERRRLLGELNLKRPLIQVAELRVSEPGAEPSPSGRGQGEGGEAMATGSNFISDRERDRRSSVTSEGASRSLYHDSPWEYAREKGWEGVIAKLRGSIYEQRRSRNWLKMKCELAQEFVVGGFTDPQGKRVGLGALLVGYYEPSSKSEPPAVAGGSSSKSEPPAVAGGPMSEPPAVAGGRRRHIRGSSPTVREGSGQSDFIFAGKIGTGFNTKLLLDLRAQLDRLEIDKPPFTKAVGLPRLRAHWVHPQIVVQVGFIQWTKHNKLRHPRLLGVRHDKDPLDVVRE